MRYSCLSVSFAPTHTHQMQNVYYCLTLNTLNSAYIFSAVYLCNKMFQSKTARFQPYKYKLLKTRV